MNCFLYDRVLRHERVEKISCISKRFNEITKLICRTKSDNIKYKKYIKHLSLIIQSSQSLQNTLVHHNLNLISLEII